MPDENNKVDNPLGEFQEELSKLKSARKLIDDLRKDSEKITKEAINVLKDSMKQYKGAADLAAKESQFMVNEAVKLSDSANVLLKKLNGIDIDNQLSQLNATVTGINSSLQNVISRVGNAEQNLKGDFNARLNNLDTCINRIDGEIKEKFGDKGLVIKYMKTFHSQISSLDKKLEKTQKLNLYLLASIIIVSGLGLLLLLIKL